MEPTPEEKEKYKKLCFDDKGKLTPIGLLTLILTIETAVNIWKEMLENHPKA